MLKRLATSALLALAPLAWAADDYATLATCKEQPVEMSGNLAKAEIKRHNGVGTLFVDGEASPRLGAFNCGAAEASFREKYDTGIQLVLTNGVAVGDPDWRPVFNWTMDYTAQKILRALPDAKIIVRMTVRPSPLFLEQNPGSRVTGAKGETVFQDRFNRYFANPTSYRPSWASLKYRQWMDGEIRAAIDHISRQPYAKNIVGVQFGAGHTEEFDQWFGGEGWPGGTVGDWCEESQARFRQWLKAKYHGDANALRQAWNDPKVNFITATIAPEERGRDAVTSFLKPSGARRDYEEFWRQQIPETIESWCRSAKLASGGRLVAGAFLAVGDSAQFAPRSVSGSPWIDFGAGPATYTNRQPGGNSRHDFQGEELRRSGKWFFDELDFSTMFYGAKEYGVETMFQTLNVLKREHALLTTEGCCGYWMEFRGCAYRHPQIWRLFRRQAEISELATRHDRATPAQVAYVTGDDTEFVDLRLYALARLGAPYHALRVESLVETKGEIPYRLIIFDLPALTPEQRAFLKNKLERDGRWLVFLRPVGGIERQDIKLEALKKRFKNDLRTVQNAAVPGLAELKTVGDPACDKPNTNYPVAQTMVADTEASPLAVWPDGSTAAALKRHADWTSVYVPTQRVSPMFLRALAAAAGVHQYERKFDDVIYGGGPFLAFHTRTAGTRKIELPEPSDLYDLYEERFIGRGQREYEVPMQAQETRFFFLGDPTVELAEIREQLDQELIRRHDLSERQARVKAETPSSPVEVSAPLSPTGALTRFLFLGPLPVKDAPDDKWLELERQQLPLPQLAGEPRRLRPAPFKRDFTVDGKPAIWRPLPDGLDHFNAADFYENPERRLVFYVATWLSSETDGDYILHLKTERGHQLWLDGKKLGEAFYKQADAPLEFPVKLKHGARHLLLFKVFSAGGGNTGWQARLTTKDGKPAKGVSQWFQQK